MRLVIGLGNPGRVHSRSRHNVGFLAVERFVARLGARFARSVAESVVAEGRLDGEEVAVCKPQTFMNLSGRAIASLRWRYHARLQEILVVCDDMNLSLGSLRLRTRGSAGGHKGLESTINALGANTFPRLRIGIGRPPEGVDPVDFVLGPFLPEELPAIEDGCERAAQAIGVWLREGAQSAMNRFNRVATP